MYFEKNNNPSQINLILYHHTNQMDMSLLTVLRYKFTGKKERYEYKDLLSW